uniref:Uncharacterized protein n=1 Tax=Romanomermis culicivorax TaxID=13658 RepID=A0A915J410_ROMCU
MERLILLTLNVLLSRIPCSMTQQTPIDSCNLVTSTLNNLSINVGRLGESFISVRNLAEQIQQKMQLQSVQLQSVHHGNQQHINPQQGNQVPQSGILNGQLQGGQGLNNGQSGNGNMQLGGQGQSPAYPGNVGVQHQNGINNGQSGNGNMQLGGQGQSPAYPGNVGVQHQNGLNNGQSGNANMQLGGQGQSPAYPGNVGVQPHIISHNAQLQQIPSAPGSGGTAQNAIVSQYHSSGKTLERIQLQQNPATLIPGSRGTLQNLDKLKL